MLKWGAEDESVLALLCSKIAVSSWAVWYIKRALLKQEFSALFIFLIRLISNVSLNH